MKKKEDPAPASEAAISTSTNAYVEKRDFCDTSFSRQKEIFAKMSFLRQKRIILLSNFYQNKRMAQQAVETFDKICEAKPDAMGTVLVVPAPINTAAPTIQPPTLVS